MDKKRETILNLTAEDVRTGMSLNFTKDSESFEISCGGKTVDEAKELFDHAFTKALELKKLNKR